jgi:sugar phosphate isomerase/epimerase
LVLGQRESIKKRSVVTTVKTVENPQASAVAVNNDDSSLKPVLHSVSYTGIWRGHLQLTLDQFLVKAKELGYTRVMLVAKRPHLALADYDAAARRRLRKRVEDLGLEIAALAGYTDFTAGLDRPGIPAAEIQAAYVGELARLAQDLGVPLVRVFTGYEREAIPFDQQWGSVLTGLRLSAREAARYGVTLIVQNHHDLALHHDAMLWLLNEVNEPNVKAGFDAWAPTLQGLSAKEISDAVHKMGPYLAFTIAADYRRFPRFKYDPTLVNYVRQATDVMRAVPMGTGIIDYQTFFGTLRDIGYNGYVAYEMCEVLEGGGSEQNLDGTARKFLEYIDDFNHNGDCGSL